MHHRYFSILLLLTVLNFNAPAQTLNLPARPTNAPAGSQFISIINNMSLTDRENWILEQVMTGNVPGWMRTLVPVTYNCRIANVAHSVTCYVAPDYFAIGSDQDYFLEPMTPILAQRVADFLNCSLPTRLMVNCIWTNAAVKLTPSPIPPSSAMITVPVFAQHNTTVMGQRDAFTNAYPLGALTSGDKKDVIVSSLIYSNLQNGVPKPVVIYGWMYTNGTPIQPEYNGHAETYADYSHGIRMVQMRITVDGEPNTVTNILSDPVLWPLLCDESSLALPRYTVYAYAPVVLTQPRSQTVKAGGTIALGAVVIGDLPYSYQWKINGAALAGATNNALTVTNAQTANAGTYTLAIGNSTGTTNSIPAVVRVTTTAFPQLFADSLSADTSANWNFVWGSDSGAPDYTTNWAFNFGSIPYTWNGTTYLIPSAPNTTDSSTRAVKFTVNNTNGVNTGVNIYPKNKSFSGNFALKFDMWINYPGGAGGSGASGTTEYAINGINHLGTEANWAATNPPATDGLWYAVDGEGGSTRDYRMYVGNPAGAQTDLQGTTNGLSSPIHTAAIYQTLFPANRFETAGVPGKNWVAGEIDQSNNVVTWKLDETVIAQRTNVSIFTNGTIMLGYMDIFPSLASPVADAYLLYDNVRVEDWSAPPISAPVIISPPQSQNALTGTNVSFSVITGGGAPPFYQWNFNGAPILNATNSSLSLAAIQTTNAGSYSVTVTNLAGTAYSVAATLTVAVRPFAISAFELATNGTAQFTFTGAIGSSYALEVSTNLINWTVVTNSTVSNNPVILFDTNSAPDIKRFYRLATAQ